MRQRFAIETVVFTDSIRAPKVARAAIKYVGIDVRDRDLSKEKGASPRKTKMTASASTANNSKIDSARFLASGLRFNLARRKR